jgi:peptidoglycan-associated lipoprotein
MMQGKWMVLAVGLSGCLLLGSGCRTKSPRAGAGDDLLSPDSVGGTEEAGYPLGARVEDGTPVTDVQFENVMFAYDSFQIESAEIAKIERVAEYMRQNTGVRLVLEGHCDERGSSEYNMSLGEYRALAVRAHLIGINVDGSLIQTRSFGEESPLEAGHDESAWRVNRRVEFKLFR